MREVRGYKVFNPDWTCRDKQYACPGNFEESGDIEVCEVGMHFCKKASDCFNYYTFDPENKVAEVIAYGTVVEKGDKCCTDKLKIVREIPWNELLEIVNTGKNCTGKCNSGDCNTGNYNSGDYNVGKGNSGSYNLGVYNSGSWNRGNRNSGDFNNGNLNSGSWNVGNWNSGIFNSGNYNSGDWNSGSFSNGCFNTESTKMYMFNRPSEWTYRDWLDSKARYLLKQLLSNALEYVYFSEMTNEEKATSLEAKIMRSYLKVNPKKVQEAWDNLSDDEKDIIKAIPNFDKVIFKETTGIDVG